MKGNKTKEVATDATFLRGKVTEKNFVTIDVQAVSACLSGSRRIEIGQSVWK
jgi:hypothetical protein